MSDKLPILIPDDSSASFEQITSASTGQHRYEELLGGVPCPSCNGSGRIAKEFEKQLVALIPLTDNRLKPRRTFVWVISAVAISLLICGFALYFLVPRSLSLWTDEPAITNIKVLSYQPKARLIISFLNSVGVKNDNYFSVWMTNATSSVAKVLLIPDRHEVIGKGSNATRLSVPSKTKDFKVWINHTVVITEWALQMCEDYYGYVRLLGTRFADTA